jgi:hypothetical protein
MFSQRWQARFAGDKLGLSLENHSPLVGHHFDWENYNQPTKWSGKRVKPVRFMAGNPGSSPH